jgi:surfactin family lipopeptide synthetase A
LKFNLNNFQKSFNLIIEKHEILRTKFKIENGKTFQIIENELKFPINLLNLTSLNENEQKLKINEIISNENNIGFDLTKLPLLKSYLIELISNKKYLFIFNIDHIIFDGWSQNILIEEFRFYYNKLQNNEKFEIIKPIIQYSDFSIWQKQILINDEIIENQKKYYQEKFNFTKSLNISFENIETKSINNGNSILFEINEKKSNLIKNLSKKLNISIFTIILSFFKILLHLYSNENEILIGVTTNNRNYNEIQNLIGFFVNSLPIKLIFDENDNYLNIIKKLNEEILNFQSNQDLPFEIIVNLLKLQRDINKNPIFEII